VTDLKAVIFDWAGTVVDYGSRAPMGAFVEVFRRFGVPLTIEQARGPMGLPKRDHIAALGRLAHVPGAWNEANGTDWAEAAIDAIYAVFVPMNADVVLDYADLIPGAAETAAALRARGLKIGSTTGHTREIMEPLLPRAAEQGFTADSLVCAGDLPFGRPTPLNIYRTFLDLAVWPAHASIKVDDTVPGIAEGRSAGTWTVGITLSGNGVGLSQEEVLALSNEERAARIERAAAPLKAAGADYIIDSVADLLPVVEAIEARLAAGEGPAVAA